MAQHAINLDVLDDSNVVLLTQELTAQLQAEQDNHKSLTFPVKALAHLGGAIAQKNNQLIGATVTPKASKQKKGSFGATATNQSSSPSNPLPNIPSSGCPSSSWPPSGVPTTYEGTGYLDQLNAWIVYLNQHPTDLTAKLSFISYLNTLAAHGVLQNSDVQNLLNSSGILSQMSGWIQAGTLAAMFSGYDGLTGRAAAAKWLADMQTALSGSSGDPTIAQIEQIIGGQITNLPQTAINFGFANGGTGTVTIGGITYQWSDPSDQYLIQQYYSNLGTNGTPDPWYTQSLNASEKAYRIAAVNSLIAEFPNDPSIVLCLFMMEMNDSYSQAQMGGLADTTNMLNNMTNQYATPLLEAAQEIGPGMTSTQAQQFVQLFYNGTNLMNVEGQLSSLAPTWNANVFSTISGQSVTFISAAGPSVTTTLGAVMSASLGTNGASPTPDQLADLTSAFKSLNLAPTNPNGSSTNGGYQSVVSALQQAGALITNTSQTLVTQLGTVSQNDNQYIKFGSSVASPTGGGFMQMELQIVNNQKSN